MTVISTITNPEALTLTVIAELAAGAQQVWEVWRNPRQLERWWGPPTYPATFTRHDFEVGGESRYYMTGPDGDQPKGYWRMSVIDEPRRLEFANGLAGDDGEPKVDIEPMAALVTFESIESGTRMIVKSTFVDESQMQLLLAMGMAEGMTQAVQQIDGLLSSKVAQ
ncbi:MAG TPA: SRPBCC domain-containing protein [Acidimicrobiales bacterium]|nr:SRPBCC domain-containing protein [Acidimicrobiales bacterium]